MAAAAFRFRKIGKFTPAFQAIVDETARKIFGNLPVETFRTGFKYLKRKPLGDIIAKHYIEDNTKMLRKFTQNFETDLEERRREKLDRLKFRGKSPPKKGHGTRATKNKKK